VATSPELTGTTGRYFQSMHDKPSRFREPEGIAELERRVDEMIARARVRAA